MLGGGKVASLEMFYSNIMIFFFRLICWLFRLLHLALRLGYIRLSAVNIHPLHAQAQILLSLLSGKHSQLSLGKISIKTSNESCS